MRTFTRKENVLTIEENLENFIDKCTKDTETKILFLRCAVNCPWHLSSLYFAKADPPENFTLPYNDDLSFCVIATRDPCLGMITAISKDDPLEQEIEMFDDPLINYEQEQYSAPVPQF